MDSARGTDVDASRSASTGLIRALKAHEDDAWDRLLELYVPLVFTWARRSGLQAEDSADVVQEVFRAVARGISEFRHDRPGDTFRGWLRTIARNKIRDHYRRQAHQPSARGGSSAHQRMLDLPDQDLPTDLDAGSFSGLVHRAIKSIRVEFEDLTWQAFWMVAVEQRGSSEVADHLQMTPGAVRQAKYRVLRRLRQELGDIR